MSSFPFPWSGLEQVGGWRKVQLEELFPPPPPHMHSTWMARTLGERHSLSWSPHRDPPGLDHEQELFDKTRESQNQNKQALQEWKRQSFMFVCVCFSG